MAQGLAVFSNRGFGPKKAVLSKQLYISKPATARFEAAIRDIEAAIVIATCWAFFN
jgi:hypothetical protein